MRQWRANLLPEGAKPNEHASTYCFEIALLESGDLVKSKLILPSNTLKKSIMLKLADRANFTTN